MCFLKWVVISPQATHGSGIFSAASTSETFNLRMRLKRHPAASMKTCVAIRTKPSKLVLMLSISSRYRPFAKLFIALPLAPLLWYAVINFFMDEMFTVVVGWRCSPDALAYRPALNFLASAPAERRCSSRWARRRARSGLLLLTRCDLKMWRMNKWFCKMIMYSLTHTLSCQANACRH